MKEIKYMDKSHYEKCREKAINVAKKQRQWNMMMKLWQPNNWEAKMNGQGAQTIERDFN